jgi:ribosome biogenesis ATPase
MQGLWSTHRRTKLNINTSSSPVAASVSDETTTQVSHSVEVLGEESIGNTGLASVATAEGALTLNGKRKVRSSRMTEGNSKKVKLSSTSTPKEHPTPTTRLSDLGGVDACVEKMLELVAMPLCHPEVYLHTGVQPPRGVLLHGPPGCGKTLLANAIAGVRSP